METSNDRENLERRVGPTVSKEKWINHAKSKMARGYVLIVGKQRRSANFYLRNKGFEMCAYNVAKQLIKEGIVVEAGEHHLGTVYKLTEDVVAVPPKQASDPDSEERGDELDNLLDEFGDENPDESPSETPSL